MGNTLLHEKNLHHGHKFEDKTLAPDMIRTTKETTIEKGFATQNLGTHQNMAPIINKGFEETVVIKHMEAPEIKREAL
jgi:hypothetical protein